MVAVVKVKDNRRSKTLRFHRIQFILVVSTGRNPTPRVLATLDVQAGLAVSVVGDVLPTAAMTLTNPTLVVAVQVAHFVEQAVAELVFRSIPEQGNLNANPTTITPVELTEHTARVVERNLHFRKGIVENGVVELVKPNVHLSESRCHSNFLLIT